MPALKRSFEDVLESAQSQPLSPAAFEVEPSGLGVGPVASPAHALQQELVRRIAGGEAGQATKLSRQARLAVILGLAIAAWTPILGAAALVLK